MSVGDLIQDIGRCCNGEYSAALGKGDNGTSSENVAFKDILGYRGSGHLSTWIG